jgi:hypothetical protein
MDHKRLYGNMINSYTYDTAGSGVSADVQT